MEVLLGLLAIEPMSGYDLGLMIRGSVGHFWNESYGQLKLFFGQQVPAAILIGYVEHMAEEHGAVLDFLEKAEREQIDANRHYPGAPYWRMAARFGELEMKAHLRWAEETLAELKKLARKQ